MFQLNKKIKTNRGMTYVELIVVLSIFAVMTSVVLFNYNKFQAQVDVKNLANDIALHIAQAQRSAVSGTETSKIPTVSPWKPAYGVYFNLGVLGSNKAFVDFVDLDQNQYYTDSSFCSPGTTGECLAKVSITKGNYISSIVAIDAGYSALPALTSDLSITFTRPDSGANIKSNGGVVTGLYAVLITVSSPSGVSAVITVFKSGRIQMGDFR